MLHEEGLENVFARHERLAEATRRAVRGWGLEIRCRDPSTIRQRSPPCDAEGHNADAFRKLVLETFNMSLGTGLNKLAGKAFRIGHLGDTNELTVLGALAGVEMALEVAGVPHQKGGVAAAMEYFAETAAPAKARRPDSGIIDVQRASSRRSGARSFLCAMVRASVLGIPARQFRILPNIHPPGSARSGMSGQNCYVFDTYGTLFDVHSPPPSSQPRSGPNLRVCRRSGASSSLNTLGSALAPAATPPSGP